MLTSCACGPAALHTSADVHSGGARIGTCPRACAHMRFVVLADRWSALRGHMAWAAAWLLALLPAQTPAAGDISSPLNQHLPPDARLSPGSWSGEHVVCDSDAIRSRTQWSYHAILDPVGRTLAHTMPHNPLARAVGYQDWATSLAAAQQRCQTECEEAEACAYAKLWYFSCLGLLQNERFGCSGPLGSARQDVAMHQEVRAECALYPDTACRNHIRHVPNMHEHYFYVNPSHPSVAPSSSSAARLASSGIMIYLTSALILLTVTSSSLCFTACAMA